MYTRFQLAKKYLHYYITASNGKGHGTHSPFVFNFIKFVLNDRKTYPFYEKAELLRNKLLSNTGEIAVQDFGAGSTIIKTNKRRICDIAASSLKPKKYSRLLFRMVNYYNIRHVLELGTSFGITTVYLGSVKHERVVTTMEGAENIAAIAKANFNELHLHNIQLITGDFENTLPDFLKKQHTLDFVFADGNHRKEPTIRYFEQILTRSHADTIIVFDDIHWSREMEEAWNKIKNHEKVTLTIDLFFIGIVFLKKDFKEKQHFTIRF